jgi:hypothetical protein
LKLKEFLLEVKEVIEVKEVKANSFSGRQLVLLQLVG